MTRRPAVPVLVGAALALGGALFAVVRVLSHERTEGDLRGDFSSLATVASGATRHPLLTATLARGESVGFEVCTEGAAAQVPAATGATLAVWPLDGSDDEVVVAEPLDTALRADARAEPVAGARCVRFAEAAALAASGRFAVGIMWDGVNGPPAALRATRFAGRVVVQRPIDGADRGALALLATGALLAVLGLALRRPSPRTSDEGMSPHDPATSQLAQPGRVAGALGVLTALVFTPLVLPIGGATLPLVFAGLLAAAQLALAWLFVAPRTATRALRVDGLALHAPARRAWLALGTAPLVGVALFVAGRVVQALVARLGPAETASSIERFVSWPSATLAVAAVALLAPLAEELFFRGFVYGALAPRLGALVAAALTALAFVLPHLPQLWGAWGAIAALCVTSIALTTLRVATGSTLVPALAHLAHNALLAWMASA